MNGSTPKTWGELLAALDAAGYAADEYLNAACKYEHPGWRYMPVWDKHTYWIACFWVVGGSEGYYCHIERQYDAGGGRKYSELMLLGKYWQWERAQECANAAQRLVNS